MRLIVAGSRTFDEPATLYAELDRLTAKLDKKKLVVLLGGAAGADSYAAQWCFLRKVTREIHRADWSKHGKAAGMVRNAEMVKTADALVAFWDGESRGTAHVIQQAKKHGLKVKVVRF